MHDLLQDVRFALRGLWTAPRGAAAAVVVLALGAGLNTTIVALAYGVLVRPLPYPEPSRLTLIPVAGRHDQDGGVPLSSVEDWQARMRPVESIAGYATTDYTLRGLGEPRIVHVGLVTDRFFDVLKAPILRGRALGPGDSAIVVSERLAQRLQKSSDTLIGRVVTLSDRALPVIGIAANAVAFPSERVDLWMPARKAPGIELSRGEADARRFRLIARMVPGAHLGQVRDDARRVLSELRAERPDAFGEDQVAGVVELQAQLVAPVRPVLIVFAIGAALVLLVACANAGSLLLARGIAREREMAVRVALGAGRWRVVRAVLVEALLLALAGAVAGAALAFAAVRTVTQVAAGALPRLHEVTIDPPVLLASLATAGLVALACGVAPALHALRTDLAPAFRQGGGYQSRRVGRVSAALVVAQIAASVVLLTGAGLLTRTVVGLLRVDAGIEPRNALASTLLLTDTVGFDAAARKPFIADVTRALLATPGVLHAGLGSSFPPHVSMVQVEFTVIADGHTTQTGLINLASVTPGYFGALGIPLLDGRLFEERDADGAEPVAVVSRTVALRLFGAESAIGRTLPAKLPGIRTAPARVVGIVGDVKYMGLDVPAGGTIYLPWEDLPIGVLNLAVRTAGDPLAMTPVIRSVIRRVDPRQPIGIIRPVEDVIAETVADRRLRALLIATFGGIALVLAVSGLMAGLARAVSERRREIAIRSALGSSPQQTIRLVITSGIIVLVVGIAVGIATTALAAGGLTGMMYGLSPHDPLTYVGAAVFVFLTGLAGCFLPARRAAGVSPAELLRSE